jgi:DnaJ-class molecular chaperone
VVEVPCTLEELFTGCDKRRKITRKRLDAATGAVREVATVLEIKILPGFKPGTRITFEGEGDEHPGVAAWLASRGLDSARLSTPRELPLCRALQQYAQIWTSSHTG